MNVAINRQFSPQPPTSAPNDKLFRLGTSRRSRSSQPSCRPPANIWLASRSCR